MDLSPCTYTQAEKEHPAGEYSKRIAQGLRWSPPAGHASWCAVELAPWLTKRHGVNGFTWNASRSCTCPKNAVGKALTRLNHPNVNPTRQSRTARPSLPVEAEQMTLAERGRWVRDVERLLDGARYGLKQHAKQSHAEGLSFAEIGRQVGLTRARIKQILT